MNRILALWKTTVGKKVAMAVTGTLMLIFLISHVISNVLIFSDPSHLDRYAVLVRSFGPALWIARIGLLACLIVHVVATWQLTQRARRARPRGYATHRYQVENYAARTMRWGGVLLAVFIVFHILHFTTGTFHPDFHPGMVGQNVIEGFRVKPVAIFYVVAMLALGMHLLHGVWSAFQTLGFSHPAWNRTRMALSIGLAVLIAGGLASIPMAALFGYWH